MRRPRARIATVDETKFLFPILTLTPDGGEMWQCACARAMRLVHFS
jgi:hypothetical protein